MKFRTTQAASSIVCAFLFGATLSAQVARPVQATRGSRIRGTINTQNPVELKNQVHARARVEFDQGAVASDFQMGTMSLQYKPSAAQQRALELFLQAQQNPNSASYHQWLTPEQFGDSFGMTQADYDQVTQWLTDQGFQVLPATRARRWISFQGTAGQVQKAFGTEIHRYLVNGELHYANATNPTVPAALNGMVASLSGLHDFRAKPRLKASKLKPQLNFTDGTHGIAPDDFATIYNVAPLYAAGFDGTGQKIAVIGQTNILLTDESSFRTRYGLPVQNLQTVLVPGETDPGIVPGDNDEANLDIQWAGAVARNAQIIFVFANSVSTAVSYAIDNNLAPVLTQSYGICEPFDLIDLPATQMQAQQANAQGITWLNASGDLGAADCEGLDGSSPAVAQTGLAVDSPADVPEITGVGGTEFNEAPGVVYWAAANSSTFGSALSYIPEMVWNDTATDGTPAAGGGGTSLVFPKPYWQAGPGVPGTANRNVPDLSLNASADHTPYAVISAGRVNYFGGTSAGTPSMAGIVAILNQYLTSTGVLKQPGLGNINPVLYQLSQSKPSVFHDTTTGGNTLPCAAGSPDCAGGTLGFTAGAGYDRASGLGSIDANALVKAWTSAVPPGSGIVPSLDQIPVFQDPSTKAWSFVITLNEEAGVATRLTSYTIDGAAGDMKAFSNANIAAKSFITSSTITLNSVAAPKNVVFVFNGQDANGQTWTRTLSAPFSGLQVPEVVTGVINAASGQQAYAPGMIASVFGTALGSSAQAATAIPLPDLLEGFEAFVGANYAPLYYVSPGQANIQIPYETAAGKADLIVGNPYDTATAFTLTVQAAAPGIFKDPSTGMTVPFASVKRGNATTVFITGEGQVRPSVPTGDTPPPTTPLANLPKPRLAASVTVGGQAATIAFIGIPSGLAGVTQVNFVVPTTVPVGVQPVVVTIGTFNSPPVNINVTN